MKKARWQAIGPKVPLNGVSRGTEETTFQHKRRIRRCHCDAFALSRFLLISYVCNQAVARLLLLPVWLAFTAVLATAWMLASAISAACLAAFCTLSYALLAAAIADFTSDTALSVPAGAF